MGKMWIIIFLTLALYFDHETGLTCAYIHCSIILPRSNQDTRMNALESAETRLRVILVQTSPADTHVSARKQSMTYLQSTEAGNKVYPSRSITQVPMLNRLGKSIWDQNLIDTNSKYKLSYATCGLGLIMGIKRCRFAPPTPIWGTLGWHNCIFSIESIVGQVKTGNMAATVELYMDTTD
jgi:hypothetical protein